jgi:hypothetical protein
MAASTAATMSTAPTMSAPTVLRDGRHWREGQHGDNRDWCEYPAEVHKVPYRSHARNRLRLLFWNAYRLPMMILLIAPDLARPLAAACQNRRL